MYRTQKSEVFRLTPFPHLKRRQQTLTAAQQWPIRINLDLDWTKSSEKMDRRIDVVVEVAAEEDFARVAQVLAETLAQAMDFALVVVVVS